MSGGIWGIVLAAGLSRRMGTAKMVLPWGNSTVIETVVSRLQLAGISDIIVVTGGSRLQVETALAKSAVRCVDNPQFANGEMLDSIQAGLKACPVDARAALVTLGDQPQIETSTVLALLEQDSKSNTALLLPSYQMRRGHPWLIRQELWAEILALRSPQTMRDFIQAHAAQIEYVTVQTSTILMDLDTPEDYRNQRPG